MKKASIFVLPSADAAVSFKEYRFSPDIIRYVLPFSVDPAHGRGDAGRAGHRRPRVIVTDKLRSYAAANNELGLNVEHRQHKG